MKKFMLTITAFAIFSCALFLSAYADNTVRVGLRYGSGAGTSAKISADGGVIAIGTSPESMIIIDKNEITVSIRDGAPIIEGDEMPPATIPEEGPTDAQAEEEISDSEEAEEAEAEEVPEAIDTALMVSDKGGHIILSPAASDGFLSYGGVQYRGSIELFVGSGGTLTVVNVVSVEDYICGVLAHEVYPSWHAEALKANAVAARTFTYSKMLSSPHASNGFDICATTHCQTYGGRLKEYASTSDAVHATTDLVLTYNGALALASYHASSGGATESAAAVWGGNASSYPYLTSVVTPYEDYRNEPNGKWVSFVTPSAIAAKLAPGYSRINYSLLDIDSFDYVRNPSGYISRMTVTDKKGGTAVISTADNVRAFFGSLVKSANFGIAEAYLPSDDESTAVNILQADGTVIVRGGKEDEVPEDGTPATDDEEAKEPKEEDAVGFDYVSSDGKVHHTDGLTRVLAFDGQGFGHGVGMSQFGSEDMAKAGFSFADILATYYPGTTLRTYGN